MLIVCFRVPNAQLQSLDVKTITIHFAFVFPFVNVQGTSASLPG
jgi:hypothetical protein